MEFMRWTTVHATFAGLLNDSMTSCNATFNSNVGKYAHKIVNRYWNPGNYAFIYTGVDDLN
jgi:hypothetical protein